MLRSLASTAFAAVLAASCGSVGDVAPSRSTATAITYLPRCPTGARPQAELDVAGLPPLVPSGPLVRCLLNASSGGSTYDAGHDHSIQLVDGRVLHLYERRGALAAKPGPAPLATGDREIAGTVWRWSVLPTNVTLIDATIAGVYVELDLPGDQSQLDTLAAIATDLRPVESLPRPPAHDLCAALRVSAGPIAVAAAFDSTAAAVARWLETPPTPDGPHEESSDWRRHPAAEPVAVCYLDGDFGPAKHPPLLGAGTEPPNWDRVVYLVGVDRRPIGRTFGWRDRIAIVDPGR